MTGPDGLNARDIAAWRPIFSGERLMSVNIAKAMFGDWTLPADVLTFVRGSGDRVIICCPFTSAPLTAQMARASGVTHEQLQEMVSRQAPLGAKSVAQWKALEVELIARICDIRTPGGRRLGDGELRIVLAGSGVGAFHSMSTTKERGAFPANESELEGRVRGSRLHRGAARRELDDIVASAKLRYRTLELGERVPVAPWFSVLHYLHIEEPSDADVRIVSSVVDDVMRQAAAADTKITSWTDADRLHRWNRDHVYEVLPEILQLSEDLQRHADVGIAFLSPKNAGLVDVRSDWWRLYDNR